MIVQAATLTNREVPESVKPRVLATRHIRCLDRGLASATPPRRRDAAEHRDDLPAIDCLNLRPRMGAQVLFGPQ